MKKNWINEFTKKMKRSGSPVPNAEFKSQVEEFKMFSELPHEQACLIGVFCMLRFRKNQVKISELMDIINDSSDFENLHEHLEQLIINGWFRYEPGSPFYGGTCLIMSSDGEFSLKNSRKDCFPHNKNKSESTLLMEMYAKTISLRHNLIDSETWKNKVKEWEKQTTIPFFKSLEKILLPNDCKSIAIYTAVIFALETQIMEINHLLKIFISDPLTLLSRKEDFFSKHNPLYKEQILERDVSPKGDLYLRPSEKWLSELIPGKKINDSMPTLPTTLVRMKHNDIKERKLYYNSEVREQIDTFREIMMPKNFNKYIKTVSKQNDYWGIIALLSGGPGTGKTELVRQLARESGRDLLYFDVSRQRNMYMGESEKAIQDVFKKYTAIVRKVKPTPILFFNEGDSVFHERTNAESGISQTENIVQTILLNELERFNGILICTTNRPESMDKAFERRFSMHIKINEPSQMVRAQLLKHNFPEINTEQLYHLSHDYEFTAANLETFKQQKMIAGIVRKKQTNVEDDLQLFFQTLSSNGSRKNRIGFNYK